MKEWKEVDHPRDEIGRFTGYGSIVPGSGKRLKISLQFFPERGLTNESPQSLRKGIKKIKRQLELHKDKLKNPKNYCEYWENMSTDQKTGIINFWQKEIRSFETAISDRIKRLRELGEDIVE